MTSLGCCCNLPVTSVRIESLLNLSVSARAKENVLPTHDVLEPPSVPSAARAAAPPAQARKVSSSSTSTRTRSASGSTLSSGRASKASTRATSIGSAYSPPAPPPKAPTRVLPSLRNAPHRSLTPSPDLPGDDDDDGPPTPLSLAKRVVAQSKGRDKASGMGVLGLGTPEIERWVKAGDPGNIKVPEREGKKVGFASESVDEGVDEVEIARRVPLPDDAPAPLPTFAMQVSPARRPGAGSWTAVPSPLRHSTSQHPNASAGSPSTRAAAGLLQTLLRDAMHEFRQETHGELVGLHLDMLRMGRGLRGEMRAAVDEFRDEMAVLREENRMLREENERLKRGF